MHILHFNLNETAGVIKIKGIKGNGGIVFRGTIDFDASTVTDENELRKLFKVEALAPSKIKTKSGKRRSVIW